MLFTQSGSLCHLGWTWILISSICYFADLWTLRFGVVILSDFICGLIVVHLAASCGGIILFDDVILSDDQYPILRVPVLSGLALLVSPILAHSQHIGQWLRVNIQNQILRA